MSVTPVLDPIEAYALWAAEYPPHAHNPLMQAEERAMLTLLPQDLHGLRVCDAGCGSGRYLLQAYRRGARELIGVDSSEAMLCRARRELTCLLKPQDLATIQLEHASLETMPLPDGWADITVCGLTLGHLSELETPLAEMRRITRPGGIVLCSEIHPVGEAMGWKRTFKVAGARYAVRHTWRSLRDWEAACRRVGLCVSRILEPRLDPATIPPDARFDPAALLVPVALAFELRREEAI